MYSPKQSGALLVLVMVYGSVFFLIVVAFMGFVVTQSRIQMQTVEKERALSIAEAGLNYYKWYLAHNPDDTTHGTAAPGPYVMPFDDSELGTIGEFSIDIASSTFCGETSSIDIYSTGYTNENPAITRTVYARYARPTVAEFAYIINSNVWAGADRVIVGPYHSNGGIRMDGTNNSTVSSGQEDWLCTSSFGCSPDSTENGVFGAGPNSHLWQYPTTPVNFTGLTVDLASMKDKAENSGGVYIAPSGRSGYRVTFLSDGTYDLFRIRSKENEPQGHAYGYHLNKIKNAQYLGNYTIPSSCPLIFVEDDLWIDGTLSSKVTIAAGDLDTVGIDPTVVIQDDILYANEDAGLLAVAENDMLVGFDVPDDMTINGIFIAQNGRFGRNLYEEGWVPNAWDEYVLRNSLTMNGTVVSNGSVGTKWICEGGVYCSGFEFRYNTYDRDLVNDPPPLTPRTSDDYKFVEWREMD